MRDAAPSTDQEERPKILVIDDEAAIGELLRVGLSYEGFAVAVEDDGPNGLRQACTGVYDLVILDVMLAGLDGFDLCASLRGHGIDVPIIMLTAKADTADRIHGLNLGADDYVTKPFTFEELLARIRAVLRRRGTDPGDGVLTAGRLRLDAAAHEATVDGRPVSLTPLEFALLELLLSHPRRVFTRQTLLDRAWGREYVGEANVVDVHVSHLRRKLGQPAKRLVQTVHGVGYRLWPDA